jgi:TetR/AcrR family transcriptional repressor of lmrAB and yxaGH operons
MAAGLDAGEKSEIVARLFVVFRDCGYEGASITGLSRATGLGKSSLYHHFPGGKEQMAEAVLEFGKTFITKSVAEVAHSSEPLKIRVRKIIAAFNELYANGLNSCVWGRLAGSETSPRARKTHKQIFLVWTRAVADLAREAGMSEKGARHFSEDWLARLQGSLILRAATGDKSPYERTMASLKKLADDGPCSASEGRLQSR